MNGNLIDNLIVVFSIVFNVVLILVFVLRAQGREQIERKLGPVVNALLIPFFLLWILNLFNGRDSGRLITSAPVILFLIFDLLYRTITKKKPYHHPERWPTGLYVYVLLYQIGSIMLNGYAFLVSLLYGYVVLASYLGSLAAYGYYRHEYKKRQKQPEEPT